MLLEEIKKDLEFVADKVNSVDIPINKKISIFMAIQKSIHKVEKAIKYKNKNRVSEGDEDFEMVY